MRVQPGMTVVAPADPQQTRAGAARDRRACPGPVYLRARQGVPRSRASTAASRSAARTRGSATGDDVALVALGGIAATAVGRGRAARAPTGSAPRVIVVSSCQPGADDDLARPLADVPLALTVEAHYVNGGLGSLVAETIAEHGLGTPPRARRPARDADRRDRQPDYLHDRHGLSATAPRGP